MGKLPNFLWSFSIAMLNYQRVSQCGIDIIIYIVGFCLLTMRQYDIITYSPICQCLLSEFPSATVVGDLCTCPNQLNDPSCIASIMMAEPAHLWHFPNSHHSKLQCKQPPSNIFRWFYVVCLVGHIFNRCQVKHTSFAYQKQLFWKIQPIFSVLTSDYRTLMPTDSTRCIEVLQMVPKDDSMGTSNLLILGPFLC